MQRKKQVVLLSLVCLFCAVFLVSGYMLLSNAMKYRAAADTYQELRTEAQSSTVTTAWDGSAEDAETEYAKPLPDSLAEPSKPLISMDFSSLQEINPEIIGWIRNDRTGIDYPVMQTDNNNYYLNHMYNGEYNSSGAIFVDYRCCGDFSDKNTVIYGHHMRNGTMFGDLEQYKDQEFFDAHPVMMLCTPNGDYFIELICGTVEDGTYEFVRFDFESDEAFLDYVDGFRARSTFVSDVEVQAEDQIISLCTCSYEWNNARYMVIGKLVRLYQSRSVSHNTMEKSPS